MGYKISCPRVNLSCISMIGVCVLLIIASTAAGDPAKFGGYGGYVGYSGLGHRRVSYSQPKKCTREVETITRKWCKLEYEKSCTTETKTFTKITRYEKGDCKEVEYCKRSYGYSGHHGYRGNAATECEKETKEVCKQVPVKEEASRDVE